MQPPLRFHASDRVSDGVSDRICRALFHPRCRVDIGAERESCAEVSQRFRQGSYIHAAFQRQGCKCVSHVMKSNMLRADFFDDPVVQPAKSIRIPCLPGTRRWEQVRIRRMAFVFFHKKFHCVLWEKNRSDGIWRFRCADDQFSVLSCDTFVDGQRAVLNVQVLPSQG